MKQMVVNDASCLIDLRKGGLLSVLCRPPYRIIVPLPIRNSELLDFSDEHWRVLDSSGMVTYDLTADEVTAAFAARTGNPALSANDCFCLVTAQINDAALGKCGTRNQAAPRNSAKCVFQSKVTGDLGGSFRMESVADFIWNTHPVAVAGLEVISQKRVSSPSSGCYAWRHRKWTRD